MRSVFALWLSPTADLPVESPRTAVLYGLPDGTSGAMVTMRAMRQLVREAIRDPRQQIRETALSIIGRADFIDQVRAIQRWVQSNIVYVRDPPDVELVQTPQVTLQLRAGDCDDQATLTAALLHSIGHPARFIAVGLRGAPLSHVLTQTLIGQGWVAVETITRKPLGWMPSDITSRYILKV